MFSKTFALAILVSGALAQSGTQSSTAAEPSTALPPGISQCVLGCIQPAAQSIGCAITDFPCVCASAAFLDAATNCLQAQCTDDDIDAALALQAQECGATTSSSSVTGSATTKRGATSTAESRTTTTSGNTSIAPPVSTSPRATSTAPTTTAATTATTTAPVTTNSNAAVGKKESMGLVGLVVAGVFGLVL